MEPSEVKQEYQLQLWSGMIRERAESGQSIRSWCKEKGISENSYYYRLKKLRQAACQVMEQSSTSTLAEVPLAPAPSESTAQVKITLEHGTVELSNVGTDILEHILRVLSHAE